MSIPTDPDYARELDDQDELGPFRARFIIDEPELIYLDGNSLGRLPTESVARAESLITGQWGKRLVRGWNESWFELPQRIGAKIAQLIGATGEEVIVADSTSVNLFKLVTAALGARPDRTKVVSDDLNFPSDLYILKSALNLAGENYRLELLRSPDGTMVPTARLSEAVDSDTALVVLSHTAFKSGYVYDMPEVTAVAHRSGALVLWDLSHSAGVMPLSLNSATVDLAVGCTYKYLNAGPGAPAFLYVRRDLQDQLHNPIAGWFGHQDPFDFALDYQPSPDIRRFLSGTPPVISLALIEPGVDLVLEAGLGRLRAKSVQQTEYLVDLWKELLAPLGFQLNSPRDASRRGSHVSFAHPDSLRIDQALIDRMGVIPDFRHPENIRFGVSPLVTTYFELHSAVMALRTIVTERLYEHYPGRRQGVT